MVPDLLVVLDSDGTVRKVNAALEQALGYDRTELYGQGFARLVWPDDIMTFVRAFTAPSPAPFRLLHKGSGLVMCGLVKWQSRHNRGFVVIRKLYEVAE